MLSITGAWRALSDLKQADIATAAAIGTRIPYTGEPIEPEAEQLYLNTDEINGELVPTTHRLLSMKLATKYKSKAFPHLVGLGASMAMGKDTSTIIGVTTAYKHKIEADKTVIELPYRTLVENNGSVQRKFAGIACVGFTISGQRGQFVEMELDLVGSGAEAVDATPAPALSTESYLAYGDVAFGLGGAFANDAVTGGTEYKASLIDFSVNYKNNGKAQYLMGVNTGYAGRVQRGDKLDVAFKAKLEIADETHRTAFLAGTEMVASIPLIGGVADGTAHYTVQIVIPRMIVKSCKRTITDGVLTMEPEFQVLGDGTNPPMLVYVTNMHVASYLSAGA